jgi:putative nucleotidyltransferase with HDIG domain
MLWYKKSPARRVEIRKNRPDADRTLMSRLRQHGALPGVVVAIVFFVLASLILSMRRDVVRWRPQQAVPYDIVSRVDFTYTDSDVLAAKRREARDTTPRVLTSNGDVWTPLQETLMTLPDRVAGNSVNALPPLLANVLDGGARSALLDVTNTKEKRRQYEKSVEDYVLALMNHADTHFGQKYKLVVVAVKDREAARTAGVKLSVQDVGTVEPSWTYTVDEPEFHSLATAYANKSFTISLESKVAAITAALLQPTHVYDEVATNERRNAREREVPVAAGDVFYPANTILVQKDKGVIKEKDWQVLRAENAQYLHSLGTRAAWMTRLGAVGVVGLLTLVLAGYVAHYQKRVVRNAGRAIGVAALLLSMLLLAQLSGVGNGQVYLFGVAPAILAAMILTLAYDQRFALGATSILGLLVTFGLDQGVEFFLIIETGVVTATLLLNDVRNRGKLIEVGGATMMALMLATTAAGAVDMDPPKFIMVNALYTGAAGLAVGFVVLGILPFIERAFRITTSMTLLELADASHPLLRRLAVEAPGTYSHSLQVATLSEAAAEAIGANSLLCRVAAYYHDVGKINKADYFVENQSGGENRHINLSPSVSLLIIIGHVKDGIELAKEYNLPTAVLPFIQQHHGTTLVEYFYYRAVTQNEGGDQPAISETQYRYPGPKPRTKEVAIVMLADAVESATRAMTDPTASRVETLVHDLSMKRLLDGQFDDCDLTMRELEKVERSLVKALLGIYHGRIAYPSTNQLQAAAQGQQQTSAGGATNVRTA